MQKTLSILLVLLVAAIPMLSVGGVMVSSQMTPAPIHANDVVSEGDGQPVMIMQCCEKATAGKHSATGACQFDCAAVIDVGQSLTASAVAAADKRDVVAKRKRLFFPVFHPPIRA